jgi:CRP/FNR family transcriptional regulator, cyclic AMP receptor protein
MPTLSDLTADLPAQPLRPGETITTEGGRSGRLYVLESGTLSVERGGVVLTRIDTPGAVIGEMAALLDIPHSATVRAETVAQVRVLDDAAERLSQNAELALHIAMLACARLDATSALLVELRKESAGKASEQTLLGKIFTALVTTPPRPVGSGGRSAWIDHE